MKIYISADIEGISGVATIQQLVNNSEYQRFRKLMTEEVNAAIRGAHNGGANEVVVADGHGNMSNIIIEDLDPRARLVSGNNRVMCQLEGLDETFDGIIFIGHHGRESASQAVISHTLAGICVKEIMINNKVVGETEMNALVAGSLKIPAIFISGDDQYVSEVKETLPDVESVVVKYARDRLAAELIHPQVVHEEIEKRVACSLKKANEIKPITMEGPITFEIEFKGPQQANMTTTLPTVQKISSTRIKFTCDDMITAYKHMWGCVIIAMAATNGVLGSANA
ncbi:M55 family metallopeptidase [Bacillus sp. S/N-304-OC-R1]|uniref:M55 family metallopeptidase n=1 Tax=Bacillus sp. S/N-304-OC-R1 TaxID=2758034 RepID=UPI001C8F0077|nr:M55 family metallopeptidase [Bacillus sp. S/N-304-OC-R1]MBY0123181.1 M55 family metallopeptidase [Bacillus sp. S/N-304-OC-R1]